MAFRVALILLAGILLSLWLTYSLQPHVFKSGDFPLSKILPLPPEKFSILVDPEEAPVSIKPSVMQGYRILLETKKNVPEFAGDRINCTNCHIAGGNTLGGEGGGISLVGIPRFYKEPHSLENRINWCFIRSLHGKPLPIHSQAMQSIVDYIKWISSRTETLKTIPWRGLKELRSKHVPNPESGANIYQAQCALCHGSDGQGQPRQEDLSYPPVWGEHSFVKEAGMGHLEKLASFVYYNMPYNEPHMTIEDAIDVSAYILTKPRPSIE